MGKTKRNPKRNPRRIGKRKHLLEEEQNKNWEEELFENDDTHNHGEGSENEQEK